MLLISDTLICCALYRAVFKSREAVPNEKTIMSPNEVQTIRVEMKRRKIGGMYYSNPSFTG